MRILIVAGGTGGHLYPGLAVARKLLGHDVRFAVRRGDMGRDIPKKEGFSVAEIAGQGLPRALSLRIFTFPFKFIQGGLEAASLLKTFRPDWVLGMGGYLSVPVILLSRMMGIRTMLHEQNVFPGLANRFLSRWADVTAVSFPASLAYFKGRNVWVSGLPIRPEIGRADPAQSRRQFGLDAQIPTVLVFGGSLGAQKLNTIAAQAWPLLQKQGISFQVIHVTGTKDHDRIQQLYRDLNLPAKVVPYCHEMNEAYAAADAVICRSGASTIAELQAVQRPALLVPYPYASNNHQLYNAQVLEKSGQGRVVLDQDLIPSVLVDYLAAILIQKIRLPAAEPSRSDSAERLAAYLTSQS